MFVTCEEYAQIEFIWYQGSPPKIHKIGQSFRTTAVKNRNGNERPLAAKTGAPDPVQENLYPDKSIYIKV